MTEETGSDEFFLAEQAFVSGEMEHAVHHLAAVVLAEPERREAVALFAKITASTDDPLSLVPVENENYAGTMALRALLCARLGRGNEALSLLASCAAALQESRLLTWMQEWTSTPSFVNSLAIEDAAMTLHKAAFTLQIPARHQEMLEVVENLRLHHPEHQRLGYLHSYLLRKVERFDEAVAVATQTLGKSDDYVWIVGIAAAHRDAGHAEEAIAGYRRAAEAKRDEAAVWLDIGDIELERANYAGACTAYEEALRREKGQPWALASLVFARYRRTRQPIWLEQLKNLAQSGNERAAALHDFVEPFFGFLPWPTEATTNMLEKFLGKEVKNGKMTLSDLEAPSARIAMAAQGEFAVIIQHVPSPDPRLAWADVAWTMWKYEGNDPIPGLDVPSRQDVVDAVLTIARSHYKARGWFAAAAAVRLTSRDEETLRDLLAVMVHPPLELEEAKPRSWLWIQRVQYAAAFLIAGLDRETPWPQSLRRSGLHSLIHGPLDWTTEAGVIALACAVLDQSAAEDEAESWLLSLYKRRPDAGAWPIEYALIAALLALPNTPPEIREAALENRRLLTRFDENVEEEDLPRPVLSTPPEKKPFWKRLFGK